MNTNREKSSSVMGFVISVLLHGIFLAGCLAIDASSVSNSTPVTTDQVSTDTQAVPQHLDMAKSKS